MELAFLCKLKMKISYFNEFRKYFDQKDSGNGANESRKGLIFFFHFENRKRKENVRLAIFGGSRV
jgi:hypothetical protein